MIKKLLAAFLVLAITIPAFVSCSTSNESALSLVPASANTVIRIQVAQILSNPALLKTYDELASANSSLPQSADEGLAELSDKTGIDPYEISTMVFFADSASSGNLQDAYGGIIVVGSFDESALIDKIEQETEQVLTRNDFKGFTVYSSEKDNAELVFIGKDRIVFGSAEAVRDTIDVFNGDADPLNGTLITALDQLGTAQITGAFLTPDIFQDQAGTSVTEGATFSPQVFQDVEMIAFAADLQVLDLNISIDAYFSNADSAQDADDAITGLISLAKGTVQEQNLKTALGNIEVNTSGSRVSVRGSFSLTDISAMGGNMPPTN